MDNTNNIQNSGSVDRLIALWALSEGFLGGFLHLAKIPLTGLILGNVAVIIITLIAKFSCKNGTILKATLIVLIVKGILSPYTPFTAYIAVALQGISGELLFYKRKSPFVSALLLGILVSLFSSLQRVIFLTIIFGQNLWETIDKFVLYMFDDFYAFLKLNPQFSASKWVIVIHISIHLVFGICTGIYAGLLSKRTASFLDNKDNHKLFDIKSFKEKEINSIKKAKHKKWWLKPGGIIFFTITISLLIYSYFYHEYPFDQRNSLLILLSRGILIMFLWYKFLSPLLLKWFRTFLEKKKNKYTGEIENVVNVLPLFKSIINFCWKETSSFKGLKRLHRFFTLALLNLLTVEIIKE